MVSYYNIDIATSTDANSYTVQDGKQVSKGQSWNLEFSYLEFDKLHCIHVNNYMYVEIIANPIAGLNILADYAYDDNRILNATDKTVEDNLPNSTPLNVANLWMSYKFQKCVEGYCSRLWRQRHT